MIISQEQEKWEYIQATKSGHDIASQWETASASASALHIQAQTKSVGFFHIFSAYLEGKSAWWELKVLVSESTLK